MPFRPGLELAGRFFREAVRPLLDDAFPQLSYAVAHLGAGSDVLGFDTERSTDHDWGPRLTVFLDDDDAPRLAEDVARMLSVRLPAVFDGWPTDFGSPDAATHRAEATAGPRAHRVGVTGLGDWLRGQLGFDPRSGVATFDWLATPTQRLAETVGGVVCTDGPGELTAARALLRWYPESIWRYLLACQWQRIAQEEAFPGRCAEVGDDLGARLVTARLGRELMRLCLLMSRRYPPYTKWLGSAFAGSRAGPLLGPDLIIALGAGPWAAREAALGRAYRSAAGLHNELALTAPLDPSTRDYYDRPFAVIGAGRFSVALLQGVTDAEVRALPMVGGVDQFVDSTDVLSRPDRARAAAAALLMPAVDMVPSAPPAPPLAR